MSTSRLRRSVSSWIALLAILMVTFAPAVTGVLSASSGLAWDQVCSASTTPSPGEPAPAAPHADNHCPYCALHADLALPPAPRQAGSGLVLAFRAQPAAFVRAPRATATWASAQPRAPPLFA